MPHFNDPETAAEQYYEWMDEEDAEIEGLGTVQHIGGSFNLDRPRERLRRHPPTFHGDQLLDVPFNNWLRWVMQGCPE